MRDALRSEQPQYPIYVTEDAVEITP